MEYELPTEFDLIVVGTGIVESIVSAAASRIGKTVLHIDSKDYYGGLWASFNLEAIQKLCEEFSTSESSVKAYEGIILNDDEKVIPIGNNLFNINNVSQRWNVLDKAAPECEVYPESNSVDISEEARENLNEKLNNEESEAVSKETNGETKNDIAWTKETLLKDARKFNIDIAPKLQFARGDFVELLISSNIARYSEYRTVSRILTWLNGQLEIVPCSRSDVFSNTKVTVIEKRMLMKLLTSCVDNDENEFKGYENKPFLAYLKDKKLTDNLIHYVLYAIAMGNDYTPCSEGIQNTKRFLNSLGRFGRTPLLYSMYGSGELSQAFCRLSAVFGGVYALNQRLNGFIFDKDNNFRALISGKQRIAAKHLVMGVEYCPNYYVKSVEKAYISRASFITDRSIMDADREHLTLLLFPLDNGQELCYVIELGYLTGTCPKGLFVVHIFTKQKCDPKEDLSYCVSKLFRSHLQYEEADCRPQILWEFYYSVPDVNASDLRSGFPKNIFACPGPDIDLDYDASIKKAQTIFSEIYPDVEFLPRAPDPEEIIIGDEVVEAEEAGSLQMENENDENAKKEEETKPAMRGDF